MQKADADTSSRSKPGAASDTSAGADADSRAEGGVETPIEVDASLFPQERFVPLELLGSGVSGTVYRCRDSVLQKMVAVKTLHAGDPKQLVAFQQEARATSRLSHPNIVQTLDFGATDSGHPYMVMELFGGRSLAEFLRQGGRLEEVEIIDLFEKICWALQYAHEKGVFHRDLKPSNLIVCDDEYGNIDVQVIDFGVATIAHEHQESTVVQGRTLAGTPAYMSPDQVTGLQFDAQSEIYMLGCVLYETMTGRVPFQADSAIELLKMHAEVPPKPPTQFNNELSDAMESLTLRCLAKKPSERFCDMRELGATLNSLRESGLAGDSQRIDTIETRILSRQASKSFVVSPVVLLLGALLPLTVYVGYRILFNEPTKEIDVKTKTDKPSSAFSGSSTYSDTLTDDSLWNTANEGTAHLSVVRKPDGPMIKVNGRTTSDDIPQIRALKKKYGITKLQLCATESGPEVFKSLSRENWTTLDFQHDVLTSDIVAIISRMKSLETITMNNSVLLDGGLSKLSSLPKLKKLSVLKALTSLISYADLGHLKALESLSMAFHNMKGDDPLPLSNLQNLKVLNLTSTFNDDRLAIVLPRLKNLRTLRIANNPGVTAVTLKAIRDMPLTTLAIGYCELRDSDLVSIQKMPLRYLDVRALRLTDASIRYFEKLPIERLDLQLNKITDAGLATLGKMPHLKALDVTRNPAITKFGVAAFKQGNDRELVFFPDDDEFVLDPENDGP